MSSLQRILTYTKKYWQRLLTSIVAATLFGLFAAAPTYLLKNAVDYIFVDHNTKIIIPFIVAFVSLFAFKGVFMYISAYYMHWVGNRVVNDIRSDLFEKIIYFPLSFYKKKSTGELMAHFLNDIAQIQNASSNAVKNGVRSLFEALALISVALIANWRLALMTSFIAPFIGISIRYMGRAVKSASRSIQSEMGSMSSVLQEIFVGIREVKIFNAESFEKERLVKKLNRYFSSVMRNVKIEALGPAFMEAVAMLGAGFVFYIAAKQVLSGSISPGQLTSFFAASLLAYQPIKRLVNLYAEVQYGLAAAERVFSLMDITYPALKDRTITAPSFNDEINFKNISFSYDSDNPVLQNVNLTIKKGERIGLLGPSGSGKSTFCDLLLGFIVPTSGKILVDGNDITKFKLHSLHNLIGSVSQQTFLFNDSVETNVAYAQENVKKEQLFDACKRAHASEFIENMPEQYQTFVGENGSRLSGGQKQRLTIARVLLKDPDVLIFDEATSSLDTKSEEMIRLALNDICKTKTVIVVSHRVSFIEKMDRIFTIQNGQFVEIGKNSLGNMSEQQIFMR